jgi:Subtilase family/Trypsin
MKLLYAFLSILYCVPAYAIIPGASGGSVPVGAEEWSTTMLLGTGEKFCTATAVGSRVILTSASCVGGLAPDARGWMRMSKGNAQLSITCATPPQFEGGRSWDLALCKIGPALKVDRVERLQVSKDFVNTKKQLTLVGYGCNDGVLKTFDGHLSSATAAVSGITPQATAKTYPLLILKGAIACPGDTGGGVYVATSDSPPSRSLIAIISSTDNVVTFAVPINVDFMRWAKEWSAQNSVQICGVGDETACAVNDNLEANYKDIDNSIEATVLLAQPSQARDFISNRREARNEVSYQKIRVRKGEHVRDVLRWTCPTVTDDTYLARSLTYLTKQGLPSDLQVFERSDTIQVPLCPPASEQLSDRLEKVITDKDLDYLNAHFLALSKNVQARWIFDRPPDDTTTPIGLNSKYFEEVFQALNPDQKPSALKPGKIILPLKPFGQSTTLPVRAQEGYTVVQSTAACSTDASTDYPFNLDSLLRVLSASLEANDAQIKPVRAIIIDSGLYGAKERGSVFRKESLYLPPTDKKVAEVLQRIKPRLTDNQTAAHGTEVASIILGGPTFARLQTLLKSVPIQLDAQRLYEELPDGKVIIPAESLKAIFWQLKQGTIDRAIVNMSFRSSEDIPSVRENLGTDKPFLFVIAAGNGIGGKGQLLSQDHGDRFPAIYGGAKNPGAGNLITVAAVRIKEGKVTMAPFSDFGSDFVEIGALGCDIPVLEYVTDTDTWQAKKVSGTSFSTPLVSFTAGLIAAQNSGMRIPEIKQRILASADLNADLTNEIVDGRSLNVAKAVGIFFDFVSTDQDMSFGDAVLRRSMGQALSWSSKVHMSCSNGDRDIPVRNLLKIAPWFNKKAKAEIGTLFSDRIYISYSDDFRTDILDCNLPSDIRIAFTPYGANGSINYTWDDISDLVFRTPSAR